MAMQTRIDQMLEAWISFPNTPWAVEASKHIKEFLAWLDMRAKSSEMTERMQGSILQRMGGEEIVGLDYEYLGAPERSIFFGWSSDTAELRIIYDDKGVRTIKLKQLRLCNCKVQKMKLKRVEPAGAATLPQIIEQRFFDPFIGIPKVSV